MLPLHRNFQVQVEIVLGKICQLSLFMNYLCLIVLLLFASNLLLKSCASVSFPVYKVCSSFGELFGYFC